MSAENSVKCLNAWWSSPAGNDQIDMMTGVHSLHELDNLLPMADIIILLVPLQPETHHLVDEAFINKVPC